MVTMWCVAAVAGGLPEVDRPVKTGQRIEDEAAVVIGIEDYFLLPDVPYARGDAQAFADFLLYTRGLPKANVQVLEGSPVREQIVTAVEQAAAEAGSSGTVWVYFAGHGAASPASGERVLVGADAQADLAVFDARSVPVAALKEAATAQGSKAIFVVDACYTGRGRGGDDLVTGKRFAVPSYASQSEPEVLEWSAAGPSEWSGPLEGAQHGAFTYAVLGALRGWADGQLDDQPDGVVTAEEADLFVAELLRELQVRDQHPVLAAQGPRDWVLSRGTERRPALDASSASASTSSSDQPTTPGPSGLSTAVYGLEDQEVSEEYRRMAEQKRLESIQRLKDLLTKADAHGPYRPEMLLRTADLYLQQGLEERRDGDPSAADWLSKAEGTYGEILADFPSYQRSDQAMYYRAVALANLARPDEARPLLEELLERFPSSAHRGEAAALLGQLGR